VILLLNTSSPTCHITLVEGGERYESKWEAQRELAHGLLSHLEAELALRNKAFADITGIGVFKGPGSFTGLRIGLTVLNTIADAEGVPIVGVTGDDWQQVAESRLEHGDDDRIVLPLYGSDAHITAPRK